MKNHYFLLLFITFLALGKAYSKHVSVNANTDNTYGTHFVFADVVLASWESSGQTSGGSTSFAPNYLDAGMTAPSALTRGSGVVLVSASSSGYFGGGSWSTTTAAAGITANKFLTFSLKPNNGNAVNYTSIDKFNIRISSTGPIQYQIDYQIDNGAFSPCATVTGPTRMTGNHTLGPIDLSAITALQNVLPSKTVKFRITPFDASGTGSFLIGSGTGDTNADLSIMGNYDSTLPITLSDFKLKSLQDKVFLNWETLSEVNFSHFVLERSTDGAIFQSIGQVKGNNKPSRYQFVDNQPFATTYYRLRQMDNDGRETLSKVVSIAQTGKGKGLAVYPNPVLNALNVVYTEESSFQILNLLGQQVLTGKTGQQLDVSALPQGTYFLEVGAEQTKFLKQ